MKTIIKIACVALLTGTAGACKKDSPFPHPVSSDVNPVSPVDAKLYGMWRISQFDWHNKEPLGKFNEYTFQINEGGVIIATKGTVKTEGYWFKDRTNLLISFGSSAEFAELNNNWKITGFGDNSFSLRGVNPQDDSFTYITFQRQK